MFAKDKGTLEAWVESNSDKKRLNEYKVTHHEPKEDGFQYTECFLETIDEEFAIKVRMDKNEFEKHDWAAICCVDGQKLPGSVWINKPKKSFRMVRERKDGKLYESALKFAPLPTTDEDEQVTIDGDMLETLGTIIIDLQFGQWTPSGKLYKRNSGKLVTGTAHEKTKKIPYVIQASNPTMVSDKSNLHYVFTPHQNGKHFYRFIFNYRPRPVLEFLNVTDKAEDIIKSRNKRKIVDGGDTPKFSKTTKKVKLEEREEKVKEKGKIKLKDRIWPSNYRQSK